MPCQTSCICGMGFPSRLCDGTDDGQKRRKRSNFLSKPGVDIPNNKFITTDDVSNNGSLASNTDGTKDMSQIDKEPDREFELNHQISTNQKLEENHWSSLERNDLMEENHSNEGERQNKYNLSWYDIIKAPFTGLFKFLSNIRIPKLYLGFDFLKFDFNPFNNINKVSLFSPKTVYVTSTVTCQ